MRFEWDDHKADSNLKKHRVTFETAITVFDDPYALIAPDEKHSSLKEKNGLLVSQIAVF